MLPVGGFVSIKPSSQLTAHPAERPVPPWSCQDHPPPQASGITTLHKAGTVAQANRQGRSGCMGSGMRSMETRSQSGAHPKGKKKEIFSSAVVTAPHQRAHQVSRPRQARPAHNFGCFEDRKLDPGNQCSVEEGPFSKRAPDRAALKDRHASSARTVRIGVPPLRVETAPP